MQVIFTQKEIDDVMKKKKSYVILFLCLLTAYLVLTVGMFVLFWVIVNEQGDRTLQTPFTVISIALSLAFIGGSIFIGDLKYRYVKAKCKLFTSIRKGDKEYNHGTVIEIDRSEKQKDDVWFYSLVVECPPVRREQQNIRHLLIENDRPMPDLKAGDEINFVAYSSVLVVFEKINNKQGD